MPSLVTLSGSDGTPIRLGPVLARAGEGTIYEVVGRSDLVAKVFHPHLKDLSVKRAKVSAMTTSVPAGALQPDGFVVLTWPVDAIGGNDGTSGYLMRRIDTGDSVEIHTISNPAGRTNPLPSAPQWTPRVTWPHLVNVAANLCLAVETVHGVDAVIGDFQERNILVNDTTRVTLVDCDSMQFTDQAGHQFLCAVGRPEFTAPELAGVNLATTPRDNPSDLFALAVHIHLLLMAGNHPFLRGQWIGPGEQPDAMSLARSGWWAGGPGSPLLTHPLAPPPSFLPDHVQRLFVRAFTDGARTPAARPTAAEWRAALSSLPVRACPRGHEIPAEADPCPWCHIDDERAQRKTQRPQQPQTIHRIPAAAPSAPPAPLSSASPRPTGNRGILVAVSAVAAIAVVALLVLLFTDSSTPSVQQTVSSTMTSTTTLRSSSVAATTVPSASGPNLAGTWLGQYRNTGQSSVQLTITDSDRLNGTIVYNGQSPCTESWRETGRDGRSIYVDEERIAGDPDECWGAKWELTITGDTINGTMIQPGQGFGAEIVLRKQS